MVLTVELYPFAILSAVEAKSPCNPGIKVPETEVEVYIVSCHFLLKSDLQRRQCPIIIPAFTFKSLRSKKKKKAQSGSRGLFFLITMRMLSPHENSVVTSLRT